MSSTRKLTQKSAALTTLARNSLYFKKQGTTRSKYLDQKGLTTLANDLKTQKTEQNNLQDDF